MSYVRSLSPHTYVNGMSEDYVFSTQDKKGESWIEDYGGMKNETIVELLVRLGDNQGNLILTKMGKRLAENLNIKLRDKPLTSIQWLEEANKIHRKFKKSMEGRNSKEVGK